MNTRAFLYGLWCLGILGLSVVSSFYGYSPFADGNGRQQPGIYGPTHK